MTGHVPPARFSALTPFYDLGCALMGFGKRFRRRILEHAPRGERILDVGCGTGVMTRLLYEARPNAKIIGIDPDEDVLSFASKKNPGGISYVAGDATDLPFKDAQFDLVISTLAVHHIEDKAAAFSEMRRVLKKGGAILIADFGQRSGLLRLFVNCMEHGKENIRGELPALLKEAGFMRVEIKDRLIWGVEIIVAS